jgi:diguanylate cyclase (GGDEF)-like protein
MEAGRGIARIALVKGSTNLLDVGDRTAVAPARRDLIDRAGRKYGRLELSTTTARAYALRTRRTTGAQLVLEQGDRTLAKTFARPAPALPSPAHPQDVKVGDRDLRAVTFAAEGFGSQPVTVGVLEANASRTDNVRRAYLIAAGILLGFLVLAITFALAVSRSLQAQIGEFLRAARRLAGGDFSTDVPTTGGDEFAALGEEFNKMSQQLATRLEELRSERARLASTLRNIGEAFASNLDKDALLEIVVRTAVDGVEAQGGRACVRMAPNEDLEERVRVGDLTGVEEAVRAAEASVLQGGHGEATSGETHAIAQPLHGANGTGAILGLVSVARKGEPFSPGEHEVFGYLAAQAAVSIENVGLHERVQRQAVTDELTGLFNHRRFQEAIESETERARRFGQEMGLVMLDIDNFKSVNDTYGHQQGDRVLAEVARVLRDRTREIDAPARYGGEELAVVLPQTDMEGAYNLAERVRTGIEELDLPLPDGTGTMRVTASLGVAALPSSAYDARELLAKADAALYQAKRAGKNRTFRAD